jgi:hypothetical protein
MTIKGLLRAKLVPSWSIVDEKSVADFMNAFADFIEDHDQFLALLRPARTAGDFMQ